MPRLRAGAWSEVQPGATALAIEPSFMSSPPRYAHPARAAGNPPAQPGPARGRQGGANDQVHASLRVPSRQWGNGDLVIGDEAHRGVVARRGARCVARWKERSIPGAPSQGVGQAPNRISQELYRTD